MKGTIRKIDLMHRMFGVCEGNKCGECSNMVEHRYDKVYRKCTVYGVSSSEATDWAKRWTACGMFNQNYDGGDIKCLVRRGSADKESEEPMEGQYSFYDENQ